VHGQSKLRSTLLGGVRGQASLSAQPPHRTLLTDSAGLCLPQLRGHRAHNAHIPQTPTALPTLSSLSLACSVFVCVWCVCARERARVRVCACYRYVASAGRTYLAMLKAPSHGRIDHIDQMASALPKVLVVPSLFAQRTKQFHLQNEQVFISSCCDGCTAAGPPLMMHSQASSKLDECSEHAATKCMRSAATPTGTDGLVSQEPDTSMPPWVGEYLDSDGLDVSLRYVLPWNDSVTKNEQTVHAASRLRQGFGRAHDTELRLFGKQGAVDRARHSIAWSDGTSWRGTPSTHPWATPSTLVSVCARHGTQSTPLPYTAAWLLSSPGSGNTMTRALFELSTTRPTASVYSDPTLYGTFWAERGKGACPAGFVVMKSHYIYPRRSNASTRAAAGEWSPDRFVPASCNLHKAIYVVHAAPIDPRADRLMNMPF
jgi:hypothetical protein